MKNTKIISKKKIKISVICALIVTCASVAFLYFYKFSSNLRYGYYSSTLRVGQIADANIIVREDVDIIDEKKTSQERENSYVSVLPVFSMNNTSTLAQIVKFDKFRDAIAERNFKNAALYCPQNILDRLIEDNNYTCVGIAYESLNEILLNGYFKYSDILDVQNLGYKSLTVSNDYQDPNSVFFERNLSIDGNLISEITIDRYLDSKFSQAGVTDLEEMHIIKDLISVFGSPNVQYDSLLTLQRRKQAYDNVTNSVISFSRGDLIVQKDKVVTNEQLYLLSLLESQAQISVMDIVSDFLFELICCFILFAVIYTGYDSDYYISIMWIITVSTILSCASYIAIKHFFEIASISVSVPFMPVFFVPLLSTMLCGKRFVGFACSILMTFIFTRIPGYGLAEFMFLIEVSFAAVIEIRFFNKRMDMIVQFLLTLFSDCFFIFVYIIVTRGKIEDFPVYLLGALANIISTFMVLSIAIPILEKIFNYPTVFRLYELSYSDSPLLRNLMQVAPGTYAHSQAVADLAETAAKAIGANSILCRAAAMYHDIGKMEHPEYFVENQEGSNKHDDINPKLSASIIKNHVKIGAEKGREAHLPEDIIQIIASHHGNDLMRSFYNTAIKQSELNNGREEIQESDFRYNSKIPQSRECGIIMIADAFEAASRTVTPSASRYQKLADDIAMQRIENGQLNDSSLTLGDIELITNALVKSLVSKNHHRIEYPNQDGTQKSALGDNK